MSDDKVKPLTLEELAAMPASELSKVKTKRRIAAALAGGRQSGDDRQDDEDGSGGGGRRRGRGLPDETKVTPLQRMSRADRSVPYSDRKDD